MNNEQARATAESVRNQENEEFVAAETDMVAGIEQMDDAITTLSEIGADQTLGDVAVDNEKFISQYGQIVGTLKNMRDTFKSNLASARATEKSQLKAHEKLMATLNKVYGEMSDSYDAKQEGLGGNDDDLAAKKTQLAEDKTQKASDEEFLANVRGQDQEVQRVQVAPIQRGCSSCRGCLHPRQRRGICCLWQDRCHEHWCHRFLADELPPRPRAHARRLTGLDSLAT